MKPLLKKKEVAEKLGVSIRSITKFEKAGLLPRIQISPRLIRYKPEAVDQLIQRRTLNQTI